VRKMAGQRWGSRREGSPCHARGGADKKLGVYDVGCIGLHGRGNVCAGGFEKFSRAMGPRESSAEICSVRERRWSGSLASRRGGSVRADTPRSHFLGVLP
jgi:hypothetical protein